MASFTANGLLGSVSSNHDAIESNLNGLPDDPTNTIETRGNSPRLSTLEGTDYAGPSTPMKFKPKGLLNLDEDDTTFSGSFGFGLPHGLAQTSSTHAATEEENVTFLSTNEFTTAHTFEGKKIYLRRKVRNKEKNKNNPPANFSGAVSKFLDVPIHRLLDNISAGVAAEMLKVEQESSVPQNIDTENVVDTLWVDRYRPARFIDLIGNERIARETLAWIKEWDWCVFGKRPKAKRKATQEDDPLQSLDEFHRPQQKILLLSGPPGLGKTTLAHVVSRQAGYEVMEINASDARTGSVVEDRIRPALESGSAVGKTKPVLLVIDEIDGATGAGENSSSFISKLLQLILHKPKRKRGATSARGPLAKPPVLRPIICICNDANASALTKLRPHTYHLKYARPADTHIVNRLRHICEAECLSVESRALSTLVSTARGDLRGCLNTLQFLKARNEHVTEATVRRATNGMKEADFSLYAILNDMFSPLSKKRVQELDLTEEEETRYVSRLSREIESSGRDISVAIGCYTQYAKMRQHDANFSRYEKANEWLITYDLFSAAMYSDGEFALLQYLPYTLVPFYPLFSQRGTQVERSQADWEYSQVTRTNEEIYKSMSRGLRNSSANCDYRRLLTSPTLQLEFVAYINRIISPPIRPINSQIVRAEERAVLTRLIDIMISLDLRFLQERTEDGQLTYRLDPPIDVFITYDGKRAADIPASRYAVRQLVANEIDARVSARQAGTFESGKTATPLQAPGPDDTSEPPSKRARVAEAVAVDFFGRPIVRSQIDQPNALEKIQEVRVTYRYAEGNSAAVRKPVKMETFF